MSRPSPGEQPVVETEILDDKCTARSAVHPWAGEKKAKLGVEVWMCWADGSRSDDGGVGPAAVCKDGNEWRNHHRHLSTGRMVVFDTLLWAIGRALGETVIRRERLQEH